MRAEAIPTSDDTPSRVTSEPPEASPSPASSPPSPSSMGSPDVERAWLPGLLDSIPHDPWYRVRVGAMAACTIGYLWWSRTEGLITDRISALIAVGVFLVCAFIGRPWTRWAQLALDACCYAALWFLYESTRGAADGLGMPLQMDAVRNIDRVLFLGVQPTEWAQRHWYEPGVVQWHDQVLSLVYYSHFVVPVMAIAAVWAASRTMWLRFMARFATVLLGACVLFVVLPTVPPWMASDERFGFGVGEPLVRHVRRGVLDLGFTGFARDWKVTLDWSNVVAAMPSLHAAFSLFVVVFFAPMIRWRWVRIASFAYPLAMAVALVYFAEHWVIDIIAGWALVGGTFALWHRLERAGRERDVAAAMAAEPALAIGGAEVDDHRDDPGAQTYGRARRDPEVVVVDRSVLDALVDPTDPRHAATVAAYATLVERYLDDRVRLVARRDHLLAHDLRARRGVLAPIRPVHVAAQYRRHAARIAHPACTAEETLTLVVARRERAAELMAATG